MKLKPTYNIPEGPIIITSVGRVGLRKGTDVIIDLYYKLKKKYDVIFLVVGPENITEISDTNASKELSKNIGLLKQKENRFKFLGELKILMRFLKSQIFFYFTI